MKPIAICLGTLAVCAPTWTACHAAPAYGPAGATDIAPVPDVLDATATGRNVGVDTTPDCGPPQACATCLQSADCHASQHCEDGLCTQGALKLCTPGANVFCNCPGGKESGTKPCLADGLSFGPCEPCEAGG